VCQNKRGGVNKSVDDGSEEKILLEEVKKGLLSALCERGYLPVGPVRRRYEGSG